MAQFLRDLLLNGYNGVKPIETIQKRNSLGQQVKDVASAEFAKSGPRVLFYKRLPSLYGSDLIRISTKGSVDPARTLAVNGSRYNDGSGKKPVGGGFGRLLGNLLGGSANRPSDTIFIKEGVDGNKPISANGQPIGGDWNGLKYAIEPETQYLVSQEPAGKNALSGLLKGNPSDFARNAVGAATGAVKQQIGNLATKALTGKRKKAIGDLKEKIAASKELNSLGRPYNTDEKKGSKYLKVINKLGAEELIDMSVMGLKQNYDLKEPSPVKGLLNERLYNYQTLAELIKNNTGNHLQYIKIKVEGTSEYLLFPATITDINDNMTPEWSAFKYVGSPFNNYRYTGVERKIGFDFKVYWIDNGQQIVMKDKLNILRNLVYPSSSLTTVLMTGTDYKPIFFTPNTIQLSIGDLFKNLKGFVSNLSISIPQEAPWASSNPNFLAGNSNIIYPTFVDVSFEMTIIENHEINYEDEIITYKFDDADEFPPVKKQPLQTQPASEAMARINETKLAMRTMFEYNDKQIRELLKNVPEVNPTIDDSYIKNY
jgi:uncharacterized protein YjbJ (UPF0337 family)